MKSARLLALILSLCTAFGPLLAESPNVTQKLVFPYVVVGGGWECDITIVNQGGEGSSGEIRFYDTAGAVLELMVDGGQPQSVIEWELLRGTSLTSKLTGGNAVSAGYAIVEQNSLSDGGSINGLVTFRYRQGGVTLQQVGVRAVPLSYSAHIPYDNTGGNHTAFAVTSIDREPVTFHRYDRYGQLQDRFQLNFRYWQSNLLTGFIDQLFAAARDQKGFIRVEAPQGAYVLVLNQNNLLLSTGEALPGVVERELVIQLGSETSWTLRLIQEGDLLYGIAQSQTGNGVSEFVSGSFNGGTLHLSLSHRSDGPDTDRTSVLWARTDSLDSASGVAVLVSEGGVASTGTFELSKKETAQY